MTLDVVAKPSGGAADWLARHRSVLAYLMIVLGLASLGGAVYALSKGLRSPAAATKEGETAAPAKEEISISTPRQREYVLGGFLGVVGAAIGLGIGVWILARLPRLTEEERRADARLQMLLAGGLMGLLFMAAGFLFFIVWFSSLTRWIDERKSSEAAWVLGPLLLFLLGAGLAFLAAQPARVDERNNPLLRRTVYGANLALSTLLLLLGLLAGNLLAALKLPAKLDTTESGFYTLSDATKEYLARLPQTITAYTNLQDGDTRISGDGRRLLDAAQAANPLKFQVRPLSLTLNRSEIESLRTKYPQADLMSRLGVLLVPSGDEKRSAFLAIEDMLAEEPDPSGGRRGMRQTFKGEALLAKELLGFADSGPKAVIYFTRASGELALFPADGGAAPTGKRAATQLKTVLETGSAEVRPLDFAVNNPKVPDDAAAVVVADPLQTLPAEHVAAIRAYLEKPQANGQKGRLVLLAGANAGINNQLVPTGLEEVLLTFGIRLGDGFLYNQPAREAGTMTALVRPTDDALKDQVSPLALELSRYQAMPFDSSRLVTPLAEVPQGLQLKTMLTTYPRRATWIEPTKIDPRRAWEAILQLDDAGAARRQLSGSARPVAVSVSEGDRGRVVVFGCGSFFTDETGRSIFEGSPGQAEIFAAAVNALRDRPAVANIASKTYGTFPPLTGLDTTRAVWLPTGLAVFGILGLGFGVWAFRRT